MYKTIEQDQNIDKSIYYCTSCAYHDFLYNLRWNGCVDTPFYSTAVSSTDYIENKYKEYRSETDEPANGRRSKLCKMTSPWMIYRDKPKFDFVCEANELNVTLNILETLGNVLTIYISSAITNCSGKHTSDISNSDTVLLFRKANTDANNQTSFCYGSGRSFDLFSENEIPSFKKLVSSMDDNVKPHGLVLFTQGADHRRSFGVSTEWRNAEDMKRIDLPILSEKLVKILKDMDMAPDGCGYFDWKKSCLVNRNGQRYCVDDYESIAGVYWLNPGEQINIKALDLKPDAPVVIDDAYIPPEPLPNCEYFSDSFQKEAELDRLARYCGCNHRFLYYFDNSECTPEAFDRYNAMYRNRYDGSDIEDDDFEEGNEPTGY